MDVKRREMPNQIPRVLFMFLGCHCQIKSQEVKFHRTLQSYIYVPWVPLPNQAPRGKVPLNFTELYLCSLVPLPSQVPSSKFPQNFTKLNFIYEVPLPNQAGIVPASPGIVPRIGPDDDWHLPFRSNTPSWP